MASEVGPFALCTSHPFLYVTAHFLEASSREYFPVFNLTFFFYYFLFVLPLVSFAN